MSQPPHDLALCVARYPLPDESTAAAVRRAVRIARRCVVVLRDSFMPRSPRQPLLWEERARIILGALEEADHGRVAFAPLRERYDDAITSQDLQSLAANAADVVLLWAGEEDHAVQRRLSRVVNWAFEVHLASAPAETLQSRLFGGDGSAAPSGLSQADFENLRAEWRQLVHEKEQWSVAPYPVVLVTVDAIITAAGQVLLIRRGRCPGKGLRALPGGFLDPAEPIQDAALRELMEETQLSIDGDRAIGALRSVRVFDHPRRSQRGRVITHAFHFDLGDVRVPEVRGSDDAALAEWVPIAALPHLEAQFHDDHFHILTEFLRLPIPPTGVVSLD